MAKKPLPPTKGKKPNPFAKGKMPPGAVKVAGPNKKCPECGGKMVDGVCEKCGYTA